MSIYAAAVLGAATWSGRGGALSQPSAQSPTSTPPSPESETQAQETVRDMRQNRILGSLRLSFQGPGSPLLCSSLFSLQLGSPLSPHQHLPWHTIYTVSQDPLLQ